MSMLLGQIRLFCYRRRLCCLAIVVLFSASMPAVCRADDDGDENIHLQAGYVNKQWVSDINGATYRENLWGRKNHFLHGIQIGFVYTPPLNKFIALHTGLLYEAYISTSEDMGYDDFNESCIYVPVHAQLTLHLSPTVAVVAHGGLGMNCAIRGSFSNHDSWYWDFDSDGLPYRHEYELDHIRYGRLGWPKWFNAQAEVALGLRIKSITVSAEYSWGLTNHHFYRDVRGSKTYQNKMSFTVGVGF